MKLKYLLLLLALTSSLCFTEENNAKKITYPVRFGYIDKLNAWWPP